MSAQDTRADEPMKPSVQDVAQSMAAVSDALNTIGGALASLDLEEALADREAQRKALDQTTSLLAGSVIGLRRALLMNMNMIESLWATEAGSQVEDGPMRVHACRRVAESLGATVNQQSGLWGFPSAAPPVMADVEPA